MDIFTMINWLSTISKEYHELMLISELNSFFNFDHNVFLLDSNITDINRFVNTNRTFESAPQSVYVFQQRHDNNITGLDKVKKIGGKNVLLVIVSERYTFQSNFNLLIEIKKIQLLKIDMKIGIFFPLHQSNGDVGKFFEWCWTEKILNIFAAFYLHPKEYGAENLLHIFSYNPFGTIDVTNMTGNREVGKFFLEKNFNFNQHKLMFVEEAVFHHDIWPLMLPIINATAEGCDNVSPYENCSADIYRYYVLDESRHVNMYPVFTSSYAIVVPEALPYKGFVGLFLAATSDNIIIVTFITTITAILLLYIIRHKDNEKNSFFKSVADVLNLLINDNDGIIYQNLSSIEIFVIVPLTFAGFFIGSGVLSILQSQLTRPFLQPQINSIEEIHRSSLPIFTFTDTTAEEMIELLEKISPYGDWSEKIRVPKNITSFILEHIAMYDTSISFASELPFANGLLKVQKMFNIKGYHVTPIEEKFDEVFVNFFAKFNFWKRMPSSEEELSIIKALAFGWISSIIVFLIEILWKKFNLSTESFMKTQKLRRNVGKDDIAYKILLKYGVIT